MLINSAMQRTTSNDSVMAKIEMYKSYVMYMGTAGLSVEFFLEKKLSGVFVEHVREVSESELERVSGHLGLVLERDLHEGLLGRVLVQQFDLHSANTLQSRWDLRQHATGRTSLLAKRVESHNDVREVFGDHRETYSRA